MARAASRWLVAAALTVACIFSGCNEVKQTLGKVAKEAAKKATSSASSSTDPSTPLPTSAPTARPAGDVVRIASFNIQVFGSSKENKPQVMDVLAQVVRRFDVVAIQELRSKDDGVVPRFVQRINSTGRRYDYVVGPRLGRTSSKEQYVYVFDAERIEVDRNSVYTASDPSDLLHREPLVASFRVRGVTSGQPFSFTLINIHTDPDETDQELDALDDVFVAVQRASREDDVILLGDLNVDSRHLGELGRVPGAGWVIDGAMTNTRRNKSYDNLVYHRPSTTEYTGYSGVLDLEAEFGLTRAEALDVSDHLPVWAEFTTRENAVGAPIATRPEAVGK